MKLFSIIGTLFCRFQDDDVPALSAQLTYYLILSFFPFLIFAAALLSFTNFKAAEALEQLSILLPELSSRTISDVFHEIEQTRSGSLLSLGFLAALWSASNGVNAIIKGINKAYDEEESRPYWLLRSISIMSTGVLVLAMMISFALLVFGQWIGEWLYRTARLPGDFATVWAVVQYVIPLVSLWLMFMLLYAYLPNLRLRLKDVLPGALFATVSWVGVSLLFSYYVNHFASYSKTYGSLGGVIVLLIWLYLSSMIILLGGELNATLYFSKLGRKKPPCKSFALPLLFGLGRKSEGKRSD
ncbi:YihY/virulence factor BrkB family protein [Paenibacillus sp. YYML68]|uniref:YihY/virulence factor BrkB family protein n=1 Tax=Paenibacillus sp. YYML68 TaxID=2909250 RepID=UPI0024917405|nr:YihY/virulence factor BrkB family protein [Paenibacillus sp. YYML68]